ncbi:MAG: hypothetical protein ACJ8AC_08655 [Gemmatimonadaceae bacterium]
MQTRDRELDQLSAELKRLDYVVVEHGEWICVRLPLLASVVIRHSEGRFRFVPQFGPFRRSGGLLFTSGVSAAAVGGTVFALGAAPLTFLVGFLGIVALAHDACRFVLTEGCLTRLQQLITSRRVFATTTEASALTMPLTQSGLLRESPASTIANQHISERTV